MSVALGLQLRPSPRIAGALGAIHAIAICALWLAAMPFVTKAVGTALLVASAVYTVRRHAFRTVRGAITELELHEDGSVATRTADGRWQHHRLVGSSFVSPVLTVLNLRAEKGGRGRSVLISADSVEPEVFRRLRVRLRWRWGENAASPDTGMQ